MSMDCPKCHSEWTFPDRAHGDVFEHFLCSTCGYVWQRGRFIVYPSVRLTVYPSAGWPATVQVSPDALEAMIDDTYTGSAGKPTERLNVCRCTRTSPLDAAYCIWCGNPKG